HIPAEVLDAWQEAGPRVVGREVASAMAALGDHGLIDASCSSLTRSALNCMMERNNSSCPPGKWL
ncbi:hypothetical protein ACFRCW_41710, partial [Streptomyces sp. NPDC056653]